MVKAVAAVHDTFVSEHNEQLKIALATHAACGQPESQINEAAAAIPGPQQPSEKGKKRRTRAASNVKPADPTDAAPPPPEPTIQQLASVLPDSSPHDPLEYGCWHPSFPLTDLQLPQLLVAARKLADMKSAAEVNEAASSRPSSAHKGQKQPRPPVLSKKFPPCTDTTPMLADAFLEHLQQLPWYCGQVHAAWSMSSLL